MLRTALAISEFGFRPSGVRVCPMKGVVQVLSLILSESMQQETIHELYYSTVKIMCCLRQSFTPIDHYDVISYVNNTLQITEEIINAMMKVLRG